MSRIKIWFIRISTFSNRAKVVKASECVKSCLKLYDEYMYTNSFVSWRLSPYRYSTIKLLCACRHVRNYHIKRVNLLATVFSSHCINFRHNFFKMCSISSTTCFVQGVLLRLQRHCRSVKPRRCSRYPTHCLLPNKRSLAISENFRIEPLTIADYNALLEAGLLGHRRVELRNGILIAMPLGLYVMHG